MVKGINKQVVLVRPKEGADFEQAIFILKSEHREISEHQLLSQAEHAISKGSSHRWLGRIILALSGAMVGAGVVVVLVFLGLL